MHPTLVREPPITTVYEERYDGWRKLAIGWQLLRTTNVRPKRTRTPFGTGHSSAVFLSCAARYGRRRCCSEGV